MFDRVFAASRDAGTSGCVMRVLGSGLRSLYSASQRDNAIRFRAVLPYIQPDDSVLEVGSGAGGLARYRKEVVVGVDPCLFGAPRKNLMCVQARGEELPFRDGQFDVVLSLDTLEHVTPARRVALIGEMQRVASRRLIVGCPTQEQAESWEDRVRQYFRQVVVSRDFSEEEIARISGRISYLEEHREHGLPSREDVLLALRATRDDLSIESFGNESVLVWYYNALAHMKVSYLRWALTSLAMIIAIRPLERLETRGCYRTIFVADLPSVDDECGG